MVRTDKTSRKYNAVEIFLKLQRLNVVLGIRCTTIPGLTGNIDNWTPKFWPIILESLRLVSAGDVEILATTLTAIIDDACDASMPRNMLFRSSNSRWTKELTKREKTVSLQRREIEEESTQYLKKLEYHSSLQI